MFEVVFLSGVRAGVVIPVSRGLIAGREADCSLEIPDPRVSRVHARIEWDGLRCELVDNESSNGTFLNEQQVKRAELDHGDVVRLGSTRLRVQRRTRTSDDQPPSSVFVVADAQPPEMSHTFSMNNLEQVSAPEVTQATKSPAPVLQHRLASMIRVSELLASARGLDELSDRVLATLFDLLPQTDRAFLMLGDRAENLQPYAMRERSRSTAELKVSRHICDAALQKRTAFVYREGGGGQIDPSMSMIDLEIRSAIAVPLMIGEEVLGLVVLDTRNRKAAYGQRDLELAAAIGHQVAIAVKNAGLLREVEQQTATRNNLMRFLPKPMADQVLAGEIDAGLGGRRYRAAVMYSDLVGFTRRAEQTEPAELVGWLNRFFNAVVPCIEVESGSIDKYMGDAILAVWGVPDSESDASTRAVSASLSMQTSLAALNSDSRRPLAMGVGINTGELVAGNIGASNRLEYTVLGDAVNTAQRIGDGACSEQVLVSEETWNDLGGQAFGVRMPPMIAKNKAEPIATYSVRALTVGEELKLFVPVQFGTSLGWLIRRLDDESFILLHQPTPLAPLQLHAVEMANTDLGAPQDPEQLPPQAGDGSLRRTLVRLADPTLAGLLHDGGTTSPFAWQDMERGEASRAPA